MADFEVTQHVFEKLVEEKTFDPVFVTHCPKELVPLARQNLEDDSLVDVFELIINGQEIAPGYTELNDPFIQRQRLLEQAGEETQKLDEDFLLALEHGMPPAGGVRARDRSPDDAPDRRGIDPRRDSLSTPETEARIRRRAELRRASWPCSASCSEVGWRALTLVARPPVVRPPGIPGPDVARPADSQAGFGLRVRRQFTASRCRPCWM